MGEDQEDPQTEEGRSPPRFGFKSLPIFLFPQILKW